MVFEKDLFAVPILTEFKSDRFWVKAFITSSFLNRSLIERGSTWLRSSAWSELREYQLCTSVLPILSPTLFNFTFSFETSAHSFWKMNYTWYGAWVEFANLENLRLGKNLLKLRLGKTWEQS